MMSSFVGRGNQDIQLVKVLYCKLPTIGKQLPTFPQKVRLNEPPTSEVEGECVTMRHHGSPIQCGNISALTPLNYPQCPLPSDYVYSLGFIFFLCLVFLFISSDLSGHHLTITESISDYILGGIRIILWIQIFWLTNLWFTKL